MRGCPPIEQPEIAGGPRLDDAAFTSNTDCSNREQKMPKYRVVTPKGASFTVAGGGYDLEREALDPIGAEIVEAAADEAECSGAAQNAGAIYAKGSASSEAVVDAPERCEVSTHG